MAVDIYIKPALEKVTVTLRDQATSQLNEILSAVDHLHKYGSDPIAGLRKSDGTILAWVEAVQGPAPQGTPALAVTRGAVIHAARGNWADGALKPGKQTLLDQYGD